MNKPVAWIDKNTGKPKMEGWVITDHDIPLYTHPVKENCCPDCGCHFTGEYPFNYTVKELTDEEIDELHKLHTTLPPKPWKGVPLGSFDVYEFARAILRKAQEK